MWSSEVEVKLIEGHGGEVHSLTCRGDSPRLVLAIFRDVTLGTSQEQPPWGGQEGRSGLQSHNTITALLLKELYEEAEVQGWRGVCLKSDC